VGDTPANKMVDEKITIIITTSPIPSHPSTAMIESVYHGVRFHLPNSPILILADGVREEQEHLRESYTEYISRLRRLNLPNVWIHADGVFRHQAGMTGELYKRQKDSDIQSWDKYLNTPLLLWVEHDFLMTCDYIDWRGIVNTLMSKDYHCIRFCHDDNKNLFDRPNQKEQFLTITGRHMEREYNEWGVPLLPVVEMDTLPHIARVDYYKFLIDHFVHGKIHVDCPQIQETIQRHHATWRVALYTPDGPSMKRFHNLMGRGSEPKYPMVF
jgi:hypothetical protein